jgi:hypothetical protein
LEVLTPTPTPTPSITPTITITSSSNKPAPPPASNTPTPTKSRLVYYYGYEKCGTNVVVWQPVPALANQIIGQTFRTGPNGFSPNSCFRLAYISQFISNPPTVQNLVYNTNAFTSILLTTYNSCNDCNAQNNGTSSTQAITPSPTPTKTTTPTKTKAPQVQACKPHTIITSNSPCNVCYHPNYLPFYSIPTNTTVYSPSNTLTAGVQIFSNSTCTSPVPAGQYIKALSSGGGAITSTLVTAGQGVLSNYSCSSCY